MANLVENADPLKPSIEPGPALKMREEPAEETFGDLMPVEADDPDQPATLDDGEVLAYLTACEQTGRGYFEQTALSRVRTAHAAIRNEHPTTSKYAKEEYRNRTKYHRPKSLQALRKALTAAANSLFATADVVSVLPGNDGDPAHRANASLVSHLLNWRLDRKNGRSAIPWYQISMGARHASLVSGYCASKQYWLYQTRTRTVVEPVESVVEAVDPETGIPIIDPMTGQPVFETIVENVPREVTDIIRDKPMIDLYPIEDVLIDPAARWENPAQDSAYLILRSPAYAADIRTMLKSVGKSVVPWRQGITDEQIMAARVADSNAATVRQSRTNRTDRYEETKRQGGSKLDNTLVWLWENFFRWEGEDYVVFTLGTTLVLSDPKPVREVYPEQGGDRPVVIGTDVIEPFELYPMSHVSAWQPMQQEINDLANLRLDVVKNAVAPLTKVRKGRNIDVQAIQRRGPNTVVLVQEQDDVEFDRSPDAAAGAYQEMDRLNADFDDLAGQFNASSVQTNRSLNETVGGMNLIAGNANATSEFDLRTWVETWVEPVLSQIVRLEQMYETDETVLALCGEKAELFTKYGVDTITDDLLNSNVMVSVNVGIGASDPQQKLNRFVMASKAIGELVGPAVQAGDMKINAEQVVEEAFGAVGYKDGGKRFFEAVEKDPNQPSPEQQAMMAQQQAEQQAQEMKIQAEMRIAEMKLDVEMRIAEMKLAMEERLKREEMAAEREMKTMEMRERMAMERQRIETGVLNNAVNAQARSQQRQIPAR